MPVNFVTITIISASALPLLAGRLNSGLTRPLLKQWQPQQQYIHISVIRNHCNRLNLSCKLLVPPELCQPLCECCEVDAANDYPCRENFSRCVILGRGDQLVDVPSKDGLICLEGIHRFSTGLLVVQYKGHFSMLKLFIPL